MLVYPIPHAVTQARVQLVADQTEKAPSHVIRADVLNVFAAKNEASRQALADFKAAQSREAAEETAREPAPEPVKKPVKEAHAAEDHVDVKA